MGLAEGETMISGSSKQGNSDKSKKAVLSHPVAAMKVPAALADVNFSQRDHLAALRDREMEEPERWDGMS
jgi:hypothetical protein